MFPIDPYKKRPKTPLVALMLPNGTVVDERHREIDLEDFPEPKKGRDLTRVWCFHETAHSLVLEGKGEALCWNGEEIRWRHRPFEEGWKNRASDVSIIKLPQPNDWDKALRHLAYWRDWLHENGAVPTGTTGSAAWSLLRSTIRRRLWLGIGNPPPLVQTLGGRQQLGLSGPGSYHGSIEQLDIPAAYATELGTIFYGGRWLKASEFVGGMKDPDWWATDGRPVFVHCRIRIPKNLPFGPLPRRPRERQEGLKARLLGATYPIGCTMQGFWTYEEIMAAEAAGCKILKVFEIWGHMSGGQQPFLRWWDTIVQGRKRPGLAGQLAKMTGNALWGRFCMDARYGSRSIFSHIPGRKHMEQRELRVTGGSRPDHALAETVSGRVRARLFTFMYNAGNEVLSVHTDGAWSYVQETTPPGWRQKARTSRLDLLDPQVLRYWPSTISSVPVAVFSGIPAERALDTFSKAWEVAGYA